MTAIKRPKIVHTEKQMSEAVAYSCGRYAAREIKVGDCIFDVVAYDKKNNLFHLVECKRGSKAATIGHAFGQIAAYHATIAANGPDFLDSYSKKVPIRMRLGRWMIASDNYRRIRVVFSVALDERACLRHDLLQSLKSLLPNVAIIRVKADGVCRHYLRVGKLEDAAIAQGHPVTIRLIPKK